MLETAQDEIDRNTDPLKYRAEVTDQPVDPLSHPAVERDQRAVKRIENIKMLMLFRRDTQPVVGLGGGMVRRVWCAGCGIAAAAPRITAACIGWRGMGGGVSLWRDTATGVIGTPRIHGRIESLGLSGLRVLCNGVRYG
ncbi:hypothetical protein SRABI106_04349 [Rahnella aquatilis]|nr:hypothetical protein SRABI106_04349 [Rahnella aquatilis]